MNTTLSRVILRRLGIDPRQYFLLVDLFRQLSERRDFELTGRMDTISIFAMAGIMTFLSAIFSLGIFLQPHPAVWSLFILSFTIVMLALPLLGEIAETVMNPREASILAHQPIGGATYIAAKLTHILTWVAVLVPAMNLLPALAGLFLKETRWFYPAMHLAAAYLAGLFIAFLVCGTYGWLFRWIPAARLKSTAIGIQLLLFGFFPVISSLAATLGRAVQFMNLNPARWAWLPVHWFTVIALLGHDHQAGFELWQGFLAVSATTALIALGLRAFSGDYLIKVSMLLQERFRYRRQRRSLGIGGKLVRKLAGDPAARASYAYTLIMMRRDWHFRRHAAPMLVIWLVVILFMVAKGMEVSPFAPGSFSAVLFARQTALFIPHILGMILMIVCALLAFGNQPRSAWVFLMVPWEAVHYFARGVYWALWMPFVGISHILILAGGIFHWGWVEGILFTAFSASLVSLYLSLTLLLLEGVPFALPFKPGRTLLTIPIMIVGLIIAAFFSLLQWLLFRNPVAVPAAAGILAILAIVVARPVLKGNARDMLTSLQEMRQEINV